MALPRMLLAALLVATLPSCKLGEGDFDIRNGIVYSDAANPNVTNGTAYDRAVLELGDHHGIVAPARARVLPTGDAGRITIRMAKTLGFMGHPPSRVTVADCRKSMGCAWRSEAGKLRLATFGEWRTMEGGASLALEILVPEGVRVERDSSYEMDRDQVTSISQLEAQGTANDRWYSLENSSERWLPVPDEPDRERASLAAARLDSRDQSRDDR